MSATKVKKSKQIVTLPPIPDKLYFSIGEVAHLCAVKPHVLRYWEQEFPILKPLKRRGSRRYYQVNEIELIRYIRHLLYDKGFTISGARKQLGRRISSAIPDEVQQQQVLKTKPEPVTAQSQNNGFIQSLIEELEGLLGTLRD